MSMFLNIKLKKVKEQVTKLEAQCPYCNIKMQSQFEAQIKNNMFIHTENCSENPKNKSNSKGI